MSRFVHTSLALILLLAGLSASATDNSPASPNEVLRLFARCDASLFTALKQNPNLFGGAATVIERGKAATIAVENPLSETGRDQVFKRPFDVDGLRLIAWRDEIFYEVDLGGFLFWGFKAEGDLKTVAKKVNAILPSSGKLANAGEAWARAEIRTIGDPVDSWRPNPVNSGAVTPKGSVERVLLLESEADGQTSVYCTLQGSVTAPLLQALRPDLTNAEYPQ